MPLPQVFKNNKKRIEINHKTDTPPYENYFMHIHREYEIYFSLSDNNKFFIGNNIFEVNKYDIFLFDNTDLHKINVGSESMYERFVVSFSPDAFRSFFSSDMSLLSCFDKRLESHSHKLSLESVKAREFYTLLEKLLTLSDTPIYAQELKMTMALAEILLFINEEKDNEPKNGNLQTEYNDTVNKIVYYINENLSQALTLESVAGRFFLNKFGLCRLFKRETGWGLSDYIQSCRLSQAIKLLRRGATVSETAYACGFNSDTYFISVFKKAIGVTPKQYSVQSHSDKKS